MNAQLQNEVKQGGQQDGAKWRDDLATKGQLIRLRRFHAERPDFEKWFQETEQYGQGELPSDALASIIDLSINSRQGYGPDPVELFWQEVGGEEADTDDPDYLQAFVEAALSAARYEVDPNCWTDLG